MKKQKNRKAKKMVGLFITLGIITTLGIVLMVQGIRCSFAVKAAEKRLETYQAQEVELSYGKMSYVDKGEGEVILSIHGIFGGYDQAFDTCKDFVNDSRIIAPSRFGYLNSDVLNDGSPNEQAKAYAELLDKLNIDKVYVLATSAGGSVAFRFALDYPERVKGLIFYCSAMPYVEKPNKYADYAGPPSFLCNNYAMFLMSPLFEPIMGMEPSTIYGMLPINKRKRGVVIDASKTNIDMARNFDEYDVEKLEMPKLILHSKDDKLANYKETEKALTRLTNYTFISFETGGHLMKGHEQEVQDAVKDFIKNN